MKRICWFLILALLLTGCGRAADNSIQVSIVESGNFTVERNGQWVEPGGEAVFLLTLEPGYAIGSVSCDGPVQHRMVEGKVELRIPDIRYPSRIRLDLTDRYGIITYHPNGGEGAAFTVSCDLRHHPRATTAPAGTFTREGYTLTGWNTLPDGRGQRIGLGSRVTAGKDGITLYAQWAKWSDETDFSVSEGHYLTVTGYHGTDDTVVIPETIGGKTVGAIAHNAFQNCNAGQVILPPSIRQVAQGAFRNCELESVVLFDSIESIQNSSFRDCENLRTLYINAIEAPFGPVYRKESAYADKVDLLILASGQRKLVCYGGCSMWYNLDGAGMEQAFGDRFRVLNLGLNGTVNSLLQMEILLALTEPGDVLFHTPELTSRTQMLEKISMDQGDDKLWCGLEGNYDLVSLVDFQQIPGLLDSFCQYLDLKDRETDCGAFYQDSHGNTYFDSWGGIPFLREETAPALSDAVALDPEGIRETGMERLGHIYGRFSEKGIRVYVGHACVNLDALPEDQRENAESVETRFRQMLEAVDGPELMGSLTNYLYRNSDFYDTNYHLLSDAARENTQRWISDLMEVLGQEVAQ